VNEPVKTLQTKYYEETAANGKLQDFSYSWKYKSIFCYGPECL